MKGRITIQQYTLYWFNNRNPQSILGDCTACLIW